MTHSFQGDAQLWPADLHHQRCRAVSHFATTPGSTRSSRLHIMPWIAVHRRHQNKVQWNRESACKLDRFASWRSEAIIPQSQDPSTGEGNQNLLDPFWARGHQYSCMSRIKATREAFLHHSSFPFSSSLGQMTGLCFNFRIKGILDVLQIPVAIEWNLAGHALASLWSQGQPIRAQSCLTVLWVGLNRTKLPFAVLQRIPVFQC